jgi:tetratricopeptide (TPR) repeat protein
MENIVEDLVALRLDPRTLRNSDPFHGLVVAAEGVTNMEAERCRESIEILEAIAPSVLDPEFRTTREAVLSWARGDLLSAREMLASSLPNSSGEHALLTGFLAHMVDFSLGDNEGLLETGRVLTDLRPTMSRRAAGLSDGLFAFALEECGHYSDAISAAERAMSINHDDVYALHAKVHVLQRLHEYEAAKVSISRYSNGWGAAEPMRIHMWWHFALGLLGEGELDEALHCYQLEVRRKTRSGAWEDLDAVALLWRLEMLGGPELSQMLVPHWLKLAEAWAAYAADPNYIFNDLHAAMAFAKAEDYRLFDRIVNSCRARESPEFFERVCRPLFDGIAAFAQRDYATSARLMRFALERQPLRIGGSKVQQNIFHWTRDAADAYLRGSTPRDLLSSHIDTRTNGAMNNDPEAHISHGNERNGAARLSGAGVADG